METTFQLILDSIEKANIPEEEKESLYLAVYNAIVDTILPILVQFVQPHQLDVLGSKNVKLTLIELGGLMSESIKDKDTEAEVSEVLGQVYEVIARELNAENAA